MPSSAGSHPQPLAPSVPGAPKSESYNVATQKSTRISHACQMCKIRKTKCDGKTPCWRCQTRQTDCNYDSSDRRRARSLLLKDFNTIRDNMKSYTKLMDLIRNSDDEGAQQALGLIRSRSFPSIHDLVHEIEECANAMGSDSPSISGDTVMVETDHESPADHPASEITKHQPAVGSDHASGSASSSHHLGGGSQCSQGINPSTPITSPMTANSEEMLFGSNLSSPQYSTGPPFSVFSFRPHPTLSKVPGTNGMDILQVSFKTACVTPFRTFNVWPKPWTSVSSDHVFTSHLISLSSAWTQCMHNFIELDNFTKDASFCKLDAKFCSPLLFNAMLAIGCLFCTHAEAFVDSLEPMSRGEHFIAEAKKLLTQQRPTTALTMENLTRLQAIPLIALFEASRMRTAAAWYYTTWFFNVSLELGLPDATTGAPCCWTSEKWRLGQMVVSYALFLTDRLWFTYTAYVEKMILSGSPPYSMANLFPTSNLANRRATIGPCSVFPKLFAAEPTPPINPSLQTNPSSLLAGSTAAASTLNSRRGSHQPNLRPSILRIDTDMHESADGRTCKLDLGELIRKLQALITADWDDGTMTELLTLHGKLQTWLNASSGNPAPGEEDEGPFSALSNANMGSVDPGILTLQQI